MDKLDSEFWKAIERRKTPHEYEIFSRVKELFVSLSEQEKEELMQLRMDMKEIKGKLEKLESQQETIMEMYVQSKGVLRFIGWLAIVVSTLVAAIDYLASHIRFLKQ